MMDTRYVKRMIAVYILVCLAVQLTGCASLAKKFTRKKKPETTKSAPSYRPVQEYVKTPGPELYEKHFIFWKTWQSELISNIGENNRKNLTSIREIIGNLVDLKGLLTEEKAAQMQPHIDALKKVEEMIARGAPTAYEQGRIRSILEKEDREIKRQFSLKDVKDFIKSE